MKTLVVIALLTLARVTLAGPSTSFLWSEGHPFNGDDKANILLGTSFPTCTSWVPLLGVTNATSITAYVTAAASAGKKCSFSIYSANGATLIATSGAVACDAIGVFQATGLTPFSLFAGVKYQRCWCGNGVADFLSYNTNSGADFGRQIKNTLSVPLRFMGSTSCPGDGSAAATIGTFTAADAVPAFVLLGTNTP